MTIWRLDRLLQAAILLSLSGTVQAEEAWAPLHFKDFGKELTSKWVPVPNGDSGAPRQGWLGTADGFFTREYHLAFDYTDRSGPDAYGALARFNIPWSRRFWTGIELPFYQQSGGTTGVGDGTLTAQFMLAETRNLSINAGSGFRLPWGRDALGNGFFAAEPQVNLWADIGAGFAVRGRVSYTFADSGRADTFNLNMTIGQTITNHDKAPFGDLSWYVAANWREPVGGGRAFVSILPGVRTHLGKNLFLLGGVEIPVSHAESFYRERIIVQFVQGF
ncbi:hypothetical protein IP88_09845 [alpha proteobacterium AAP81b]|nr:hypothetical protein IP88_09845 [alpha proteobacterium AAP81b]